MGEDSDAVWLVRFAGEQFAELALDAARAGADRAGDRGGARGLSAKAPEERRDSLTWPAAALTLVRAAGGRLDAWTLADTVALLRRPDGRVFPP